MNHIFDWILAGWWFQALTWDDEIPNKWKNKSRGPVTKNQIGNMDPKSAPFIAPS